MFQSIVVGIDGSETAGEAVRQAIELAAVGGAIELVSAYEPVPNQRLREEARRRPRTCTGSSTRARTSKRRCARRPTVREAGVTVKTFARQGDPADAILDVAEERGSDLIVVGNKGMTGAKRFLLGSVPNKVSHHAPCSVLIIRTT